MDEFPLDVFVAWRTYATAGLALDRCPTFLWLHDKIMSNRLHNSLVDALSGIFVLSEHHASQLPAHAKHKGRRTFNGLVDAAILDGPNDPNEFIFASHPERGLEQLLAAWSEIRQRRPNAVLRVYHGFPKDFDRSASLAPRPYADEMRRMKARVEQLRHQPGVVWYGMVDQDTLAAAYARAGFWLYPTSIAETSCVSAMRALVAGCLPVTSGLVDSGLPETVGEWDMGPGPQTTTLASSAELQRRWVDSVVSASRWAELNVDEAKRHRQRAKQWARGRYTWRAVAKQWAEIFTQHINS